LLLNPTEDGGGGGTVGYDSKLRKKEGEGIGNSSSCRKGMREKQTENCSWQDLFFVSNGELQALQCGSDMIVLGNKKENKRMDGIYGVPNL